MRIAELINDSVVDGPGLRLAVFAQGCLHGCKGCHNPATHALDAGYEIEIDSIINIIKGNPLLDGITLTGGEPFLQAKELAELAEIVQEMGLSVMTYTGFTIEYLLEKPEYRPLLLCTDILIDGPFEQEQRSIDLQFRGSRNQRIIDMRRTLREKIICLHELYECNSGVLQK